LLQLLFLFLTSPFAPRSQLKLLTIIAHAPLVSDSSPFLLCIAKNQESSRALCDHAGKKCYLPIVLFTCFERGITKCWITDVHACTRDVDGTALHRYRSTCEAVMRLYRYFTYSSHMQSVLILTSRIEACIFGGYSPDRSTDKRAIRRECKLHRFSKYVWYAKDYRTLAAS
jgi:hypothetical protein